ncbi:D-glucuronyl C5-epimerase family protein [Stutzerimonas chloritidismutans]|uniref:D-glucuronyl C5-epimerase family protein n=1 Tax=Stutzerimonas chloritidismutans TaxID=203192 RepID=UPI003F16E67E
MSSMFRYMVSFILCAIFSLLSLHASARSGTQTNVDQAQHVTDGKGIPQLSIENLGTVPHPAWTGLYALAYAGVEDYDPALNLKADSELFNSAVDWLKANLAQDEHGLWVWQYSFDSTYNDVSIAAPWSSAFAQAVGIQALLAHWKQTGDRESLVVAKKAAESLFVPLKKGGFLFSSGDDVWFEEIPAPQNNPSHILNGHMRTLLALAELADATGEKRYEEWFVKGSDTLLRWLPLYDAGYWLRYDLNPRKEELLFRLANPYGFANPELAIDRIVLRDPLTGEESVLDVGAQGDAEGSLRIAGNDWGQIEQIDGRTVRRLRPAIGEKQDISSDGQMASPYSYFYLTLPNRWADNLRTERFELTVEYFDEQAGNLAVEMRSIAPGRAFRPLANGDLLLSGAGKWREWRIPVAPRSLGYWVGDTYAIKHAEYLQALAARVAELVPWAETAEGYWNQLSLGHDYSLVKPKPIVLPEQTPPLPFWSFDAAGVVMMHMPDGDKPNGKAVYSPYIVASQALDGQNMAGLPLFFKRFALDPQDVRKEPAVQWLLNKGNYRENSRAAVYEFMFQNVYNDVVTVAPWASSFGQNYVLKALTAVSAQRSDDASLADIISKATNAYTVPIESGGFVHSDRLQGVFFEEVPNATHILNGHISALPVLHQVSERYGLSTAMTAFQRGVDSVKDFLDLYDTGYWLRYDLNPKKELLFQIDWLSGEQSPLVASVELQAPQFKKKVILDVAGDNAFEGPVRISGNDWSSVNSVDGRQARSFINGYAKSREDKAGGMRHQVYMFLRLPRDSFRDYFDVQSHRLVIKYKDVAPGRFVLKIQPVHEGNVLEFVPLRDGVLEMVGDQQWKVAHVELRPQDMGWYKGPDYQIYEVQQLKKIAELTGDWFFQQYAERHQYYLEAKQEGRPVIFEPARAAPPHSWINSFKDFFN